MTNPASNSTTATAGAAHRHRLHPLEWLTVIHVSILAVSATWAFGGQAEWVRRPLVAWASLGGFITLATLLNREARQHSLRVIVSWMVPLLLFNAVVLAAALNPSLTEIRSGADILLAPMGARAGWPSSARPALAREALWAFDATWLSCFNLAIAIRHRRALRLLLAIVCGNALVLAVFGTMQKLVSAPGLFFGAVPSPQEYFFSSFVYHNHWGAFILLMISATLALMTHYSRRHSARRPLHSPAATGVVAVLLLAATIPLSGSRSSTILGTLLLGTALVHWTFVQVQKRRRFNEAVLPLVAATSVAVAAGAAGIGYLGRDTIAARSALTVQQVQSARTKPDSRLQLYHDTWRMAQAKPWFGWGMASYPYVFTLFNSRTSPDRRPLFYHDAHSDWLQALAEHGFVGTALLALSALLPLAQLARGTPSSPLSVYLLAGCAVILVYALLEFPFGNFAVVLTWWLCFFAAMQYGHLTWRKKPIPDSPAS